MRAILLILIIAVVGLIGAIASGLISVTQTRPAQAPDIEASANGISARGGQTPSFDIETGSVSVGAQKRDMTVSVPTVKINRGDQERTSDPQETQPSAAP